MKKIVFCSLMILLLSCTSIHSTNTVIKNPDEELPSFLPQSGDVKDWSTNERFEEYKGEDLFFYINGGAEIYHEYGFERVIVQDYKSKTGKSASLEIYEMTDPSSAYGMYSFKSGGEGKELDLGHGGKLQDYYLNFWKGKYLVTITGFDEEEETIAGIQFLGKAADSRMTQTGPPEKPSLVQLLPEDGLKPQDVKYFQGNLGLFNSYPFTTKSIFKVKEAVKGTYNDGYDIYIFAYDNEEVSHQVFRAANQGLKKESRYKSLQSRGNSIELIDEKETHILIKPYKNYITIILGTPSFDSAAKITDNLQSYIDSRQEDF
ncbi:DUF6599 family protein [Acidobacteriota bacterium]